MEPSRLEPTRKIALRIWWAIAWRLLISLLLIALLQGFVLGVLSAMFHLTPGGIDTVSGILTLVLGVPLVLTASWECVYRVLHKKLGGFEIALIRRES